MERDQRVKKHLSLMLIVLLASSTFIVVANVGPAASAAVNRGTTTDLVDVMTPYIRDDSSAIPLWGIGATTDAGETDLLTDVQVVLDTSGTDLRTNEIKDLDVDGAISGIAIFRDDGNHDDQLDSRDTPIDLLDIGWRDWANDDMCEIELENEWVPTDAELVGNFHWFIVVRTDSSIDEGDELRTYINADGIRFSDGTRQPAERVTGEPLEARETGYLSLGSGPIGVSSELQALGLSIVDGGPYEIIDQLTIVVEDDGGFQFSDLEVIDTDPTTSGLALFHDDGSTDDVWDPQDTGVVPTSAMVTGSSVIFEMNAEPIPDSVQGTHAYLVVVRTSDQIQDGDRFTVHGNVDSIVVDGTPDTSGDQDLTTPEDGNDDSATFFVDLSTPTITSVYWEEDSPYLHVSGRVLWFSSLMNSGEDATFNVEVDEDLSPSGLDHADFSAEPSLGEDGGRDRNPRYTHEYTIDGSDDDRSSPAEVTVFDEGGNQAMASLDYAEDNDPPEVDITSPALQATVSGTVMVTVTAEDDGAGVNRDDGWVSWDYGDTWHIMAWTGQRFELRWDTALITDGPYRLLVRVRDNVKNNGIAHINLVIDNTGPVVVVLEPADGRYVHSNEDVDIGVQADDPAGVDSVEFRIDDGDWESLQLDAVTGSWIGKLDGPGEGIHTLEARATDGQGNRGLPASVSIVGDDNDPHVSIVSPSSGSELSGTVLIRASASDDEGLASVAFILSGILTYTHQASLDPVTGLWEVTLDTSTMPGGTYHVTALARDVAGRSATDGPVNFLIDNEGPSLTVEGPVPGQVVNGTYIVSADPIDVGGADFDQGNVWYSVDGGNPITLTPSDGGWTADIDTTALDDGQHMVVVTAIDDAGNPVSQSFWLFVDNTSPSLYIADGPPSGTHVAGNVPVAVYVADAGGVAWVTVTVADGHEIPIFLNPRSGLYEWTFRTALEDGHGDPLYADGQQILVFSATDVAGHTSDLVWTLFVDNTGPDLKVTVPSDAVKGKVVFKVTAIDASDVSGVQIRIGDGEWRPMMARPDDSWTWEWVTDLEDNAEGLDVEFKAIDGLGNTSSDVQTIDVDNMNWVPILILLAIIAITLLILFRDRLPIPGSSHPAEDSGEGPEPTTVAPTAETIEVALDDLQEGSGEQQDVEPLIGKN